MVRVGLYCRDIGRWGKGVGKYVREILRHMLATPRPDVHYFAIVPRSVDTALLPPGAEPVFIPDCHRVLQDHFFAARAVNRLGLDVAWLPKNVIPYGLRCKAVVSFLDLAYFMPEFHAYPLADSLYMKRMFRRSARRADAIVAISENTRQDGIRLLGVPEERIKVIYPGISDVYHPIVDAVRLDEVRARYKLPEQFVFYAGGISPRKNLPRLLEAFRRIQGRIPHALVVTGWNIQNEKEWGAAIAGLDDRLIRLGKVPIEDMPALFNLASIYAHLSLYEGFGFTVPEAQACGTPVLNANVSCMPEIGGEGALYVDPTDIAAVSEGILRLATDPDLVERLAAKGLENARRFRWDEAAGLLQDLLVDVARR